MKEKIKVEAKMRNGTGGGSERRNEGTEQLQIVEEPVHKIYIY